MKRFLLGTAIFIAAVYFWNASWLAPKPENPQLQLIAHRGVHQTYHRAGLDNDTCTAARIDPPRHEFIENTVASMQAAFKAGADIVELDVHPTTDGRFAVMHDWTVDCRTAGTGETRSHDMAYLKSLDIGYGYTADDGKTFPFRGKGTGLMPSLDEVLSVMPDRRFLVNFKSNEMREGEMLGDMLEAHPDWRQAVWGVYGGDAPTMTAKARRPELAA
jgi:glycerophosphoryl diester phosphodiesterase